MRRAALDPQSALNGKFGDAVSRQKLALALPSKCVSRFLKVANCGLPNQHRPPIPPVGEPLFSLSGGGRVC